MTSKEKKLKAAIELAIVGARIDELKRSRSYYINATAYRSRLTQLEEKAEKLRDTLAGVDRNVDEVKLVFRLPEELFSGESVREPEDIIQFLKREYLEVV
jgi:hypothetical protein